MPTISAQQGRLSLLCHRIIVAALEPLTSTGKPTHIDLYKSGVARPRTHIDLYKSWVARPRTHIGLHKSWVARPRTHIDLYNSRVARPRTQNNLCRLCFPWNHDFTAYIPTLSQQAVHRPALPGLLSPAVTESMCIAKGIGMPCLRQQQRWRERPWALGFHGLGGPRVWMYRLYRANGRWLGTWQNAFVATEPQPVDTYHVCHNRNFQPARIETPTSSVHRAVVLPEHQKELR